MTLLKYESPVVDNEAVCDTNRHNWTSSLCQKGVGIEGNLPFKATPSSDLFLISHHIFSSCCLFSDRCGICEINPEPDITTTH